VWILELWSTIGVIDCDMEQPSDGVAKLRDIYLEINSNEFFYFLFCLQTLFVSELFFKQDMSNYAQRVFIARNFIFIIFYSPRIPTSKMVSNHSKV
jgi:hypothetical protein